MPIILRSGPYRFFFMPVIAMNRTTYMLRHGCCDTIRFLSQFSPGCGGYAKDRENWMNEIALDDAITQIKA